VTTSKKQRNKRNSFVPTKVIGVRAECAFWDLCDETARAENTTRNGLVIKAVSDYIENKKR
jgi:predicted DNA-binding ribbon-helix-helix protein